MTIEPRGKTSKPQSGRPKPTSWGEWLRRYALMATIHLAVMIGGYAISRLLFHRDPWTNWETAIIQAFTFPFAYVWLIFHLERKVFRFRPRRVSGLQAEIQVLHRLDGKVVATVEGHSLHNVNLAGANLRAVSLWGEDLEGADFSGASLPGACLRGAILDDANCSCADLRGADLMGASLRNTDLRGADLRDISMNPGDLAGAIYDHSTHWGKNAAQARRHCILWADDGTLPVPASPPARDPRTLPLSIASAAVRESDD